MGAITCGDARLTVPAPAPAGRGDPDYRPCARYCRGVIPQAAVTWA